MSVESESPFYDPKFSYEDNYDYGPFGEFASNEKETLGEPENSFLGVSTYTDFGVSAGLLLNSKYVKAAFSNGYDVAYYKTVRRKEYKCNQFPNILPLENKEEVFLEDFDDGFQTAEDFFAVSNISNSFGVPSKSFLEWLRDAKDAVKLAQKGQVTVVSFQGTPQGNNSDAFIKDVRITAKIVNLSGTLIAEQDGSCPCVTGNDELLCFNIEESKKAVIAAREGLGPKIKLLYKIAFIEDKETLKKMVEEVGPYVDGFTAINAMSGKVLNGGVQAFPGEGRERAGVSGNFIKPYGLEMVRRLVALRERTGLKFKVIGVGGVIKANDYLMYKDAGADGVLSATGVLLDPKLGLEIKDTLGVSYK